jgi:hypothetical protein
MDSSSGKSMSLIGSRMNLKGTSKESSKDLSLKRKQSERAQFV